MKPSCPSRLDPRRRPVGRGSASPALARFYPADRGRWRHTEPRRRTTHRQARLHGRTGSGQSGSQSNALGREEMPVLGQEARPIRDKRRGEIQGADRHPGRARVLGQPPPMSMPLGDFGQGRLDLGNIQDKTDGGPSPAPWIRTPSRHRRPCGNSAAPAPEFAKRFLGSAARAHRLPVRHTQLATSLLHCRQLDDQALRRIPRWTIKSEPHPSPPRFSKAKPTTERSHGRSPIDRPQHGGQPSLVDVLGSSDLCRVGHLCLCSRSGCSPASRCSAGRGMAAGASDQGSRI